MPVCQTQFLKWNIQCMYVEPARKPRLFQTWQHFGSKLRMVLFNIFHTELIVLDWLLNANFERQKTEVIEACIYFRQSRVTQCKHAGTCIHECGTAFSPAKWFKKQGNFALGHGNNSYCIMPARGGDCADWRCSILCDHTASLLWMLDYSESFWCHCAIQYMYGRKVKRGTLWIIIHRNGV